MARLMSVVHPHECTVCEEWICDDSACDRVYSKLCAEHMSLIGLSMAQDGSQDGSEPNVEENTCENCGCALGLGYQCLECCYCVDCCTCKIEVEPSAEDLAACEKMVDEILPSEPVVPLQPMSVGMAHSHQCDDTEKAHSWLCAMKECSGVPYVLHCSQHAIQDDVGPASAPIVEARKNHSHACQRGQHFWVCDHVSCSASTDRKKDCPRHAQKAVQPPKPVRAEPVVVPWHKQPHSAAHSHTCAKGHYWACSHQACAASIYRRKDCISHGGKLSKGRKVAAAGDAKISKPRQGKSLLDTWESNGTVAIQAKAYYAHEGYQPYLYIHVLASDEKYWKACGAKVESVDEAFSTAKAIKALMLSGDMAIPGKGVALMPRTSKPKGDKPTPVSRKAAVNVPAWATTPIVNPTFEDTLSTVVAMGFPVL